MKNWKKWLVIALAVIVIVSEYGHVFFGSFGVDTDGYTADQLGKKSAYKLYGEIKQQEINSCFRNFGIDPMHIDDVKKLVASGAINVTPQLMDCIQKKIDGYASPKKDIKEAANGIKDFFTSKPDSQLFRTVKYNPRKSGKVFLVEKLGNEPYDIKCSGAYIQRFLVNSQIKEVSIGCDGIKNHNMPQSSIIQMPIEDPNQYGSIIINKQNGYATFNINIPQTEEEYKDITGELILEFYR